MQYRKTAQRERVLEILRGTTSHPTADWIYEKLKKEIPGLSLGTVYRNLKVLVDQGLIQKLPFGSTYDRYDATTVSHCHLICEKCGKIQDFDMEHDIGMNDGVEKKYAFTILRHRIDFFGICGACQKIQ